MRQKIVEKITIEKQEDAYLIKNDGEVVMQLDRPLTEAYIKKTKLKKTKGVPNTIEGGYTRTTIQEVNRFVHYNGNIWRIWDTDTRYKYPGHRYNQEKETLYTLIHFGRTIYVKQDELFPPEQEEKTS